MHFGDIDNLYWLLVLLPMAAAGVWYWFWQRRVHEEIGEPELVREMAESHSSGLRVIRIGLVLTAIALLVVASARPQWGRIQQTVEKKGIDLVFALDLSKSMLARDIPPTRLESASDEIEQTLDRLAGDRVGMVVFTTVSFVQSPLTTDYGALRFYLKKLDPNQMSIGGTAIGSALTDTIELLTGQTLGAGADSDSQATRNARIDRADNQVVVLITDGEDHQTNPVDVAKKARELGIRVVTVGVGTSKGARIPILGRNGKIRGYKRSKSGEPVRTKLKGGQLEKIAKAGGGIYIPYKGQHSVTDRLYEFIRRLEKSNLESQETQRYRDRFMWFLVPGFLLLLVAVLLGERRTGRLGWGGSNESTSASTLVLLVLLAGATGGCQDLLQSEQATVEQGNRHLEKSEWGKALKAYERAEKELDDAPPALAYNRGLAELGHGSSVTARELLARGLESDDPQIRFDAHYNIGLAFAKDENWKEAVDAFESAFRVYADNREAIDQQALENARHNTELAYRKLYPPCRTQEDKLEENDQPGQAQRLEKPSKKDLTLCGLDDDWFEVPAVPGSTVTVRTTFRQLREPADPERTFLPTPSDLKLQLYDTTGEKLLAEDRGADAEKEPKESGPVSRSIAEFEVPRGVALGKKSALKLRVAAADQLQYGYDIRIEVTPPCRALEEKGEENDTPEQATTIEKGKHPGQICGDDPDWYRVDAEMGDSVFFDLRPVKRKKGGDRLSPGQLQLEVVDADTGEAIDDVRREGPFWTVGEQQIDDDRSYLAKVSAADSSVEGAYRLDAYVYAPCIIGDDKYEENDSFQSAATFKGKSKHHRYLRLCPKDPDYFQMKPSKPQQPKGGPTAGAGKKQTSKPKLSVGLSLLPRNPDDELDVALRALDPSSGQVVASAKPVERPAGATGESDAGRFDQVLQMTDVQQKSVPVRVNGDSTFYHLTDLSKQNQRRKNNQKNQKKQNQNQKKKKDGDRKKDRNKKREKRQQSKSGQKKKSDKEREKKAAKRKKMDDILKALEDSDQNFQMRKALEDARKRQGGIDRDW